MSDGTQRYKNKAGEVVRIYHRYRCTPKGGTASHTIKLVAEVLATDKLAPVTPAPACPDHPRGEVTRAGTYKRKGQKRQMYRCDPGKAGKVHRFTPPLPRTVVPVGEACERCENAPGVHQGDQAAARTFQPDGHLVARVIARIGRGDSYAKTGLWARAELAKGKAPVTDEEKKAAAATPKKALTGANGWRLAADWTEVFVPPLWTKWDRDQRTALLNSRPGSRSPLVIVIDDVPLFNRAVEGGKGSRQRFSVLALGVVGFDSKGERAETKIRLLRAFPDHTKASYQLLLHEFGVTPDFIVADGSHPIVEAVRSYQAQADRTVTYVLSEFHIKKHLNRAFDKMRRAQPLFHPGPLADQLNSGACMANIEAWQTWWDQLRDLQFAQKVPEDGWPQRWVDRYYEGVSNQLVQLAAYPQVPRSTGALETVLLEDVGPRLQYRKRALGNQERTNILLDAITLHLNGQLEDEHDLAIRIQADAAQHKGFVPMTRQILDPVNAPSLLARGSSDTLAKALGL